MGLVHSPSIVTNGLIVCLDAANARSYSGSGSTWADLSGNGNDSTIDSSGFDYNTGGYFSMSNGGVDMSNKISTAKDCTCVYWMKTTDTQSIFLHNGSSIDNPGYFLGAYRVNNKFYNGSCGTPTFFMDTISRPNIYDHIIDGKWHMLEFKSVDLRTWSNIQFSKYSNYKFSNTEISSFFMYNRNLTQEESRQNFNAFRGRFSI